MNRICAISLCSISLCTALLVAPVVGQDRDALLAGEAKTYFWLGLWPDLLAKYDPVTDKVVQTIQLRHGLQWGVRLRHDQKQMFVITDQRSSIEVVDLQQYEVVDEHDFRQPDHIIRVQSVREIPGGTHWYVNINRIEQGLDHFVIKKPQWLLYNVADKEIEDQMEELPEAIRSGARISPGGTKWHVFRDDIHIVDPLTLEEEGVIDLTTPLFTGMGAIEPVGEDFYHSKNPDAYRMLYTMDDPVREDRSLFGVVDINIKDSVVQGVTEWGANPGYRGFFMSKDRKVGVASTRGDGDGYERRVKLALFDLETGVKLLETLEQFPPRRQLTAISPDGKKVYIGGAGNNFLILNDKLERIGTVEFDGDMYGSMFVVDG